MTPTATPNAPYTRFTRAGSRLAKVYILGISKNMFFEF